jgi:hypothetical protein
MCCCGKNRKSVAPLTDQHLKHLNKIPGLSPEFAGQLAVLKYVGANGLTVRGPFTGRFYRFARSGAHVVVDSRDAAFLIGIRTLRRVPIGPRS